MLDRRLLRTLPLVLLALVATAAADDVAVTPAALHGWTPSSTGGSSVAFVTGPGTPLCGTGSAELRVDPSGATDAQLRNANYAGVRLADLTALSYATYVQTNQSEQAVYVILNVDFDANGTTDDLLFFEPVYQSADFCPDHPQAEVLTGTWQTWDALEGCWWSLNGTAGAGPGTNVKTLSAILAAEPDARIATSAAGAVRLVAGFGGPSDWGGFVGNVDCFRIAVLGEETLYDFEQDDDGDGVPDGLDECPGSDVRPFVDANGDEAGATSVPNTTGPDGCTIQDEVNECAATSKNHGKYVHCVHETTKRLHEEDRITKAQKKEIDKAAAQSDVGKKPKS
jgi:hypothetical protein